MKKYYNLRKSTLKLFTLLAMLAGTSPSWAQTTDDFSSYVTTTEGRLLGDDWEIIGNDGNWSQFGKDYIHYNEYDEHYIAANATTNYTRNIWIVLKKTVTGTVSFTATNGNANSALTIYVSKAEESGDSYAVTGTAESYSVPSRTSTAREYTFDAGSEPTYIAFCLAGASKNLKLRSVTYTETTSGQSTIKKPANLTASNIMSSAATISWTKGSEDDTAWQIVYSTDASFDKNAATPINVSETTYSFAELDPSTTYYVAVRTYAGDGEGEQSAWVTTSFKTTKEAVPARGFSDNFETDKHWDLINYATANNKWVRGTGTSNGGSYSLYVSNDGSTYKYGGGGVYIYAAKLFTFEAGNYTISYDWKGMAEAGYDYLRVALVPASEELAASTTHTSIGPSALPEGWVPLDGGSELNGSSTWTTKSADITIDEAANYQVVFVWRNDYSGGSEPAAIDNFKIMGSTPILEVSGDVTGNTLAFGTTNTEITKTIRITNIGMVAMQNITLNETADPDNVFACTALPKTTLEPDEYMDVTVTFTATSTKDYTGTIRIAADDVAPMDINITASYSNTPATMAVSLDAEAVGTTVAFGNNGKQAVKTFTIANDGDQTLFVTLASDNAADFTVSPAELEVAGKSCETFTVTFVYNAEALDTEKTATITVTPSNEGLEPVSFTVTGTRIEMWSEDFSGNALPEGWETTSEKYWTFADGYAHGAFQQSNYYLITPSIVVEEGASLNFDVRGTTAYTTMTIEKQKDNGAWTEVRDITYPDIDRTLDVWKTFTIDNLEAGNYRFRFNARGYDLDNFEGFKRNTNAPKLGIYTDEECTIASTTAETKSFGFVKDTQIATYYIKNIGTGTMEIAKGDDPAGFTATLDKTAVLAGEYATLTITMPVEENTGFHSGDVVVTATKLGTFTVGVTGVIIDEQKLHLDFATDTIPATWTANGWKMNEEEGGYIEVGYASDTLETCMLVAAAGEQLVVQARQSNTWMDYSFGVKYKKKDAEEWSDLIPAANIGPDFVMLHGTIAEAGNYQLQFCGKYTQIQHIYGLEAVKDPVVPSSIANVARTNAAQPVYTLSGQRVHKLQHGLYIQNGRKVIKR